MKALQFKAHIALAKDTWSVSTTYMLADYNHLELQLQEHAVPLASGHLHAYVSDVHMFTHTQSKIKYLFF